MSVERDRPFVGHRDTVENTDEGCLSGTIGTEESEDLSLGNFQGDIIEGRMAGIMFRDVGNGYHS